MASQLGDPLARAQEQNDELREQLYQFQMRNQENPTTLSQRARELLQQRGFSDQAIAVVDQETRLCLRGLSSLSDEEILWMGTCAETGVWPVVNASGAAEVQLSLAQRFGPERLSRELELVALWNLLFEVGAQSDIPAVWGEHLASIYRRLPPSKRVWLQSTYHDALLAAGVGF
ncbi:MAG: hypothetical protein R3F33_03920 [Planctomycetota bacterium]